MSIHELAVLRLRRRIALALGLKQAVILLAAWAFLWGTAVVVLRVTLGVAPVDLLWGLAAAPVLLGMASAIGLRRLPTSVKMRALYDRASGAGGLLLAEAEKDLGGWTEALPVPPDLRVRWHGGRAWTLLGCPCISLPVLTGPAGLPLGLQVVGARGRDPDLISAAAFILRQPFSAR